MQTLNTDDYPKQDENIQRIHGRKITKQPNYKDEYHSSSYKKDQKTESSFKSANRVLRSSYQ